MHNLNCAVRQNPQTRCIYFAFTFGRIILVVLLIINYGKFLRRPFLIGFVLCYRTVVCLSYNVCVLWPNGRIDQDATWYGGTGIGLDKATLCKMGTQMHPTKRGTAATATVVVYASIVMSLASLNRGPCLLWPNGWIDQDAIC